ncbi:MAG: gamma-glutamyl-gamma-aminobutyrate hydrolase family protein [Planctomycetota bacterium]|jgi:putative glutamine amidotransferase
MSQPVIGITTGTVARGGNDSTLVSQYYDAVPQAYGRSIETVGGLPILLPTLGNADIAPGLLERIDGLLLAGGDDVNPLAVGEEPHAGLGSIDPERDTVELALVKAAFNSDMPILGICRGIQVLALALGGLVYQDVNEIEGNSLKHRQLAPRWCATHTVMLGSGSIAEKVLGGSRIETNSFHHQAVRKVPKGFEVSGHADDGVIEAIECAEKRFVLGVQWHAEHMTERHKHAESLFRAFVDSAQ